MPASLELRTHAVEMQYLMTFSDLVLSLVGAPPSPDQFGSDRFGGLGRGISYFFGYATYFMLGVADISFQVTFLTYSD